MMGMVGLEVGEKGGARNVAEGTSFTTGVGDLTIGVQDPLGGSAQVL